MHDMQGLLESFCFPADSDKAPSSNIQKNWADAAAALLGPVAPRQQLNSAFSDALASRAGALSLAIAIDPGPGLFRTICTLQCTQAILYQPHTATEAVSLAEALLCHPIIRQPFVKVSLHTKCCPLCNGRQSDVTLCLCS